MITILLSLVLTTTDLDKAYILSRDGDHEGSELILKKEKSSEPAYAFYRLVNAFKLNRKTEGIKWADTIIYWFGDNMPQRYHDLAIIMKADMQTWKDDFDDLEDISREMTKITDRLKHLKGGGQTQQMQKDVLARLDKMIKDLEDKKNSENAKNEEEKNKQILPMPIPPPESVPTPEQGTGQVDKKKIREITEVWGKLPEKERARAIVGLVRNLPPKDRAVIENYLKALQRRSSSK